MVSVSEISQQLPLTVSGNCYVTSASEIPCNKANTLQITAVVNPACYLELSYFELPAISNSSFFPYTSNQPRYFELVKNRVQEYIRPTKSEIRQAIETLSRCILLLREPRFEGKQASCHSTKVLEKKKQKHRTFKGFSIQQHLPIYRHIITVFLFSLCLSSYCTVFY